jgi:hypothetical protein
MRKKNVVVLGSVLALWASAAHADVVWPVTILFGIQLEYRLVSVPVIVSGLVVEWLFIYFGLRLNWVKATIVDVTINAASAIIGLAAIPISGVAVWDFFHETIISPLLKGGTFMPLTWVAIYVLAVAITTAIEVIVAKAAFKLMNCRRDVMIILAANATSVGIAFASLFIVPLPHG